MKWVWVFHSECNGGRGVFTNRWKSETQSTVWEPEQFKVIAIS